MYLYLVLSFLILYYGATVGIILLFHHLWKLYNENNKINLLKVVFLVLQIFYSLYDVINFLGLFCLWKIIMNYDILIENLKIFYDHNKKHINNYKIIDFPRITNILNKIKIAKYLAHIDYYLNYVDIELDKYINLNFGEFNFDENPEDNNITLEKIMNLPEINDLEVMDKMINDMINDMGNSDKNENINKALEKMINDMNVIQPPKLNRTQRRLAKKHK